MSTEEQLRAELEAAKSWISGDSVRIGKLRRELERVKADRDELRGKLNREIEAADFRERDLRASVAEMEEKAERYRLTTLRQDARLAELEAALREEKRIHPEDFQQGDFRERALACAESATPAKHPDTERLDWLEAQPSKYEWAVTLDHGCVFVTRNKTSGRPSIRAAIDTARKEESAR